MKVRKRKWMPVWVLVLALCVILGTARLDQGWEEAELGQLEEAVRRAAVACYGAEGIYPPDVDYLCRHYGLRYDETRYVIHYVLTASNLMPDITVMGK